MFKYQETAWYSISDIAQKVTYMYVLEWVAWVPYVNEGVGDICFSGDAGKHDQQTCQASISCIIYNDIHVLRIFSDQQCLVHETVETVTMIS